MIRRGKYTYYVFVKGYAKYKYLAVLLLPFRLLRERLLWGS